jgi:ElaB/YqjD/DUF883 family membrane-anchored ribosome-binding protein
MTWIHGLSFRRQPSLPINESQHMTSETSSQRPTTESGAPMPSGLQQSMRDNTHDTNPMVDRLAASLQDMAHKSQDAAADVQHRLELQAKKATSSAEHYIQQAPLKSVLMAAGMGAAAGMLASWWLGSRSR